MALDGRGARSYCDAVIDGLKAKKLDTLATAHVTPINLSTTQLDDGLVQRFTDYESTSIEEPTDSLSYRQEIT